METLTNRFLRYVAVETTSNPDSETFPSAECEWNLLRMLAEELKAMGIEANVDQYGYVMATIPSNLGEEGKNVPAVGFIAHVDTAPDASGKDIKPQIIENYKGGDIVLNERLGIKIAVKDFPEIEDYKGQTIITTDGTTLLGADDKAGVAEIMQMAQYIVEHPQFKHGEIKIGFTPDEEIGRGVDYFDVAKFGAKYAYTMDGGKIGELEFENFNAASAKIHIQGRNVHPGYAKNKMINAILIAMELNALLPVEQRPEYTQDYEGFFHVIGIKGAVEEADIQYIIRDHSMAKFKEKKRMMQEAVNFINTKFGEGTATLEMKDQYYNMREEVMPHKQIIDIAVKAMEDAGVKPVIQPIRGGTDGARLSFMGLPCPNIFAGGHNFHGKLEYLPVESMQKAYEVVLNIISNYAKMAE
ncbi:MAG: peptidase T [Bacteroidales bacterium]|nr:peptidase T [Bacteroidales bacterium]